MAESRFKIEFQRLSSRHDRSAFNSGVEALDRYLQRQAGQDAKKHAAVTFVLTEENASGLSHHWIFRNPPINLVNKEKASTMPGQILDRHIEITPDVAGGKPRIVGHRIKVQDVVIWHERMGKSADEICAEYDLALADVYGALAYYFDHREEIDKDIHESDAFVRALRDRTPSVLEEKLKAGRGE